MTEQESLFESNRGGGRLVNLITSEQVELVGRCILSNTEPGLDEYADEYLD